MEHDNEIPIEVTHQIKKPDNLKFENVTFARVNSKSRFLNPWITWSDFSHKYWQFFSFMLGFNVEKDYSPNSNNPNVIKNLPVHKPVFVDDNHNNCAIRLTWFGHASVLCRINNVGILCDPVFSHRCSATQYFGPARYRPSPCKVLLSLICNISQLSDIPRDMIDVVVISHNHYDHMDMDSIAELAEFFPDAVWCVPYGDLAKVSNHLEKYKSKSRQQPITIKEFLWWEQVSLADLNKSSKKDLVITFTPAQHWSGRALLDKDKALWGSWAFKSRARSFWFAGDTGYCSVFKDIGSKLGPFDLAAIPIGAYCPRDFLRPQHVDPEEAVLIHRDIQAKRSVGIHWGTFALANENYMRPKEDLLKAVMKHGLNAKDFTTLEHGKSLCIPLDKNLPDYEI